MWIATAEQMRQIDRRASEEYGIPQRLLMERAGEAVFAKVREMLPEGGALAVICGKGNNGGDGLVVARLAHDLGYVVTCLVAAQRKDLSPLSAEVLEPLLKAGIEPTFSDEDDWKLELGALGAHDLVVDALLGTGAGPMKGQNPVQKAIWAINESHVPVLSVDVPSGIHCDNGGMLCEPVMADETITFGLPKPFLFCGAGVDCSGHWAVADIGIPSELIGEPTGAALLHPSLVSADLPVRPKSSHKGQNGHVLVVAGSLRFRGAAVLAALGVLKAGAGLVTVASIEEVCAAVAAQVPEAMLFPLPRDGECIAREAAQMLEFFRCDVGLFGPGLTQGRTVQEMLANLFSSWDRPAVVDADALPFLSREERRLPPVPLVLTPHPGEMGRLLGKSANDVEADRFGALKDALDRFGSTVVLKGANALIGTPQHPLYVNATGNSGLATGGSGDVLSGVIAALMAQGCDPHTAAACGVFWHGASADLCADEIGEIGYGPSDVARALPHARMQILRGGE